MWSSEIVESADPDEFMSSIRPHGCEILVTERGSFDARSVMVDIDRLYLQRRRERLARLVEVDLPRSGIIFLTEPGPSMFWNGAEIGVENLALFGPGPLHFAAVGGDKLGKHVTRCRRYGVRVHLLLRIQPDSGGW